MPARIAEEVILEATVATVIDKGYSGATTRHIANLAGINEVTLFRRFGDKRTLVLAAILAQIGRFGEAGTEPTGDLEADLLRVVGYYSRMFEEHGRLLLTLITEATRNAELAELLYEPLALLAGVEKLIATYQASGELRPELPALARNCLIGPILAQAIVAQLNPTATTVPTNPRHLVDFFLQGHAAGSASSSARGAGGAGSASRRLSPE